MTYFPLYDYNADPFGVMSARRRQVEAARRKAAKEAEAAQEAASADPPPPVEGDHGAQRHGIGAPSDKPVLDRSEQPPVPLHHPADGPPPLLSPSKGEEDREAAKAARDAADRERARLIRDWIYAHYDTILEMARAEEAPQRPPMPPPAPEPGTALAVPAEPPPPPYVEPGDRWTKWKMAEFLRQLAATQNVTTAAKAVGMGRQSAYKLRNRLKGQPFDIAWEAAFRHGYDNLAHSALELALEGEEVPHYHHGELVGTHRKRNPHLIVNLLKMRNQAGAPMLGRYGAAAEYWSEGWERMIQRVETGSVTWSDEREALGAEQLDRLALPDTREEVERIIERNKPDEGPKKRFLR